MYPYDAVWGVRKMGRFHFEVVSQYAGPPTTHRCLYVQKSLGVINTGCHNLEQRNDETSPSKLAVARAATVSPPPVLVTAFRGMNRRV